MGRLDISVKGPHAYQGGTAVANFVSFSKAVSTHRRASKALWLVGQTVAMVLAQGHAQILCATAAPLVRDHGA